MFLNLIGLSERKWGLTRDRGPLVVSSDLLSLRVPHLRLTGHPSLAYSLCASYSPSFFFPSTRLLPFDHTYSINSIKNFLSH